MCFHLPICEFLSKTASSKSFCKSEFFFLDFGVSIALFLMWYSQMCTKTERWKPGHWAVQLYRGKREAAHKCGSSCDWAHTWTLCVQSKLGRRCSDLSRPHSAALSCFLIGGCMPWRRQIQPMCVSVRAVTHAWFQGSSQLAEVILMRLDWWLKDVFALPCSSKGPLLLALMCCELVFAALCYILEENFSVPEGWFDWQNKRKKAKEKIPPKNNRPVKKNSNYVTQHIYMQIVKTKVCPRISVFI